MAKARGMTLIELLVGITIGLLVILAATASLIIVRGSSRSMTDSAALEQQATLAMLQIGQQVSQAGTYNAYAGINPNAGVPGFAVFNAAAVSTGDIQFDNRPIGVLQDNSLGTTLALSTFALFGSDGAAGPPPTPDTLYVSYGITNDGSPSTGCAGVAAVPLTTAAFAAPAARTVSVFTVNTATNSLTCDTDPPSVTPPPPIAANVADMRVSYLSIAATGNVTYYANAAAVAVSAASQWNTINGVQVCLEMVGDRTQAPKQTYTDCRGGNHTPADGQPNDGRLHRIVRNTFYLRNPV
jgi:type IV pilus assembly protein PilW